VNIREILGKTLCNFTVISSKFWLKILTDVSVTEPRVCLIALTSDSFQSSLCHTTLAHASGIEKGSRPED
jgi:hypothetical protein